MSKCAKETYPEVIYIWGQNWSDAGMPPYRQLIRAGEQRLVGWHNVLGEELLDSVWQGQLWTVLFTMGVVEVCQTNKQLQHLSDENRSASCVEFVHVLCLEELVFSACKLSRAERRSEKRSTKNNTTCTYTTRNIHKAGRGKQAYLRLGNVFRVVEKTVVQYTVDVCSRHLRRNKSAVFNELNELIVAEPKGSYIRLQTNKKK